MKSVICAVVSVLALSATPAFAAGKSSCDTVKAGIEEKLKAKKVTGYSLEAVDAKGADKAAGKVVGSCDGGAKKVVYSKK